MKAKKVFSGEHYEGYIAPNGDGYTGFFLHFESGRRGCVVEYDRRETRVEKTVQSALKVLEAYHESMLESPAI